ncbi:U-box domain-containing protein [Thalictrum thalictroides]|uniref:RING-type E3 ubiquitin transferase n=1 Tax=Thalictrum thalictroides TaxID=46969 RepID=A0A7J6XFB4_THATH|nr:U-box domain-containing protein [Thalictrum thalictroides]
MNSNTIAEASYVPASEVLAQLVEFILSIVNAANDVLIEKKSFLTLKSFLERIASILRELSKKNIHNSQSLINAIDILSHQLKLAKQLIEDCSTRNRVYLFVNCRRIVKRLEDTTREISKALGLIPMASLDVSSGLKEEMNSVCEDMLRSEFSAAIAEEAIMEKIESGIQERNLDRSYANKLLVLIAHAIGISTERTALKKEFEEFKNEINDVLLRKDKAENIQMEQIIALLGRADATSTPEEKEKKYLDRRNSLGSQPLEPLQTFYCPITKDVMVEPVETSSGQTFEKSAIVKWLAEGNRLCPLTMTPLNPEILRPNRTLRQSIEEWKDRNNNIIIASMKLSLLSHNEQEMLRLLGQLQDLCEEKDSYREWVVLENYIPLLIGLLKSKDHEIRKKALLLLCLLAKDGDDIKEKIADVENAIGSVVNSIGRPNLSKFAVALLLELSKSSAICERIGKVQGCILYLVNSLRSDDLQVAGDAKELLQNLAFLDQNIIEMAKANYFKHLLQRLSSGPEDVKLIMAATVAELELTEPNKATLFEEGVLDPVIHMLSQSNTEMKKVAVKALRNLSSVPQNAFQMIRGGAVIPLLDLLCHSLIDPSLKEEAAATIMNLSLSTRVHEAGQAHVALLENDDDIFRLFSLINIAGPNVQQIILRTFNVICQPPSVMEVRSKLRQDSTLQVLIQLCEIDDFTVRANAVKLFYCLTQDDDGGTLSEYVSQKFITTLLKVVSSSNDEEEIAATLGIISNLPVDHAQITEWLLEAGALPIIFKILTDGNYNGLHKDQLIENAVGSICRFAVSTHQEWQKQAAQMGIISSLVQLLGFGTPLTKEQVAISLAEFSRSSTGLSRQIERRGGFWCCSAPSEIGCSVHMGICTVESSFCLVEAGAINPLARVLGESDLRACEASLRALLTLIDGEKLQNGSRVLDEANAIAPVIRLLSSPSLHLQEMALNALERIFGQVVGFKQKYGASAQMPLIDITQRGTSAMKSLAARTLGHLGVLHQQSSYF